MMSQKDLVITKSFEQSQPIEEFTAWSGIESTITTRGSKNIC